MGFRRDIDPIPELKRRVAAGLVEETGDGGQRIAGMRMGATQSDVSALFAGHLERFSLDRLIRFMARAHGDVTLTVTWTNRGDAADEGTVTETAVLMRKRAHSLREPEPLQ